MTDRKRPPLPVLRKAEGSDWEDQTGPAHEYPSQPADDWRSPTTEVVWCPFSEAEHAALKQLLEERVRHPPDRFGRSSAPPQRQLEGALDGVYAGFKVARESKLVDQALGAVRTRKAHGGLR